MTTMTLDRYTDMSPTVARVQQELNIFLTVGDGLSTSHWATGLLRKKLSGQPIRAYFVSKTAQWIHQCLPAHRRLWPVSPTAERLYQAQLPFVFEVIITVQYLHNQVLDGKSGVTTRERISQNLLAANLLKEQLYRYLDTALPRWARAKTTTAVRRCFEWVDHGQRLEQTFNTYNAFTQNQQDWRSHFPPAIVNELDWPELHPFTNKLKADLPALLHPQLDIYFNRIALTCATLFVEASRLLGQLMGLSKHRLDPVLQFSRCYGIMRQLVNDNADWVPSRYGLHTKTKTADDHFSDLRNATLTLPLLYFLAEKQQSALQQIMTDHVNWESACEEIAFAEILQTDALFKSIQNTRILSELALAYLPLETYAGQFLADSCEIVHWNRFLAPILRNTAYQRYRKTSYRRKTKQLIQQLRTARTSPESSAPLPQQQPTQPVAPAAVLRLWALLARSL